jgi:beta-lactamase regulating signal transducer with metallopeptidase domain
MKTLILTWIFENAVIGGGLLTVGCLLAALCRSPIRRLRLLEWTLVATLIAPVFASTQVPWTLPLRWLPARPAPASTTTTASAPSSPGLSRRPALPNPASHVAREDKTGSVRVAEPGVADSTSEPWNWPDWGDVVLAIQAMAVTLLAAKWLVGTLLLARVSFNAKAIDGTLAARIDEQIPERLRRSVTIRLHPSASTPSVFGLFRPCILLPEFLTRADQAQQMSFALAHESSHVLRGDLWSWRLVRAAQFALWFQPAYWWMRRQVRLCQDYLSDFDATMVGKPADLADFLLQLARIQQSMPTAVALSMRSHRTDLSRRICMLLKPDSRLECRCPPRFQAFAALTVFSIIALAAVVRLEAQELPKPKTPATTESKSKTAEAITYHSRVVAAGTDAPIAGATVVVRRSLSGDPRYPTSKILQETTHKTDEAGRYSFTLPPEQVGQRYLYLEFDVSHPDYAPRNGHGYALGMIRKNEKLGGRPFFEITKLYPAKTLTGTVVTPDGKPAANVAISGWTYPGEKPYLQEVGEASLTITGSFEKSSTDEQGRFRLVVATPGQGGFWLQPAEYAPMGFVAPSQRSDVGTIRLKAGLRTKGQVLDSDGKPVAGILVSAFRRDSESPEVDSFNRTSMAMGGYLRRATTDATGRFELAPVDPGKYEFRVEADHQTQTVPKYAGAFLVKTLSVTKNDDDLKLRAVPTVEIRVKNVDAKGKPKRGFEFHVFGRLNADSEWFGGMSDRPTSGLCTAKVPKGLQNVQIQFMDNEHGSFRVRRSSGAAPEYIREIKLDKVEADLDGIEVIRYTAPILMVKAVDPKGHAIQGFETTGTFGPPNSKENEAELRFEKQPDGRWRSSSLIPDAELTIRVKAAAWKSASRTVTLHEGEVRELAFSMVPE